MGMKTQYTWKFVAGEVLKSVILPEAWKEVAYHVGMGLYALFIIFVRVLLVLLFPITVPFLVFFMRMVERKDREGYEARRAARDADV